MRDDAARGSNDGREQLGVVTAARPEIEHRHAGPDVEKFEHLGRLALRVLLDVADQPARRGKRGSVVDARGRRRRGGRRINGRQLVLAFRTGCGRTTSPKRANRSAYRMVRLLNNPPTTAVHRNAVCRRPSRRQTCIAVVPTAPAARSSRTTVAAGADEGRSATATRIVRRVPGRVVVMTDARLHRPHRCCSSNCCGSSPRRPDTPCRPAASPSGCRAGSARSRSPVSGCRAHRAA